MSDLETFVTMLDRCRIQHSDNTFGSVTSVSLKPDNINRERYKDDPSLSPNLTGDHWAKAKFDFSDDGRLLGIEILGD